MALKPLDGIRIVEMGTTEAERIAALLLSGLWSEEITWSSRRKRRKKTIRTIV